MTIRRQGAVTRLAALLLGWTLLSGLSTGCVYQTYIVDEPGEHISRAAIEAIISQESPVLYRDGRTPMGVFFSQEHRIYVRADDLPEAWIQAIVAAEDQRFFDHPGFDWRGIARAMLQNIKAGRVVAGGSTLTQQTAKNLYYRPDRSLRSKWEELLNALRLEAHFSKREILEFYANQFHVSANGRGLAIAARYFFDKEPRDLTVLECAFIAGLVKAPASYNPFVGATEEKRAEARHRADVRVRYVLDRMLEMGYLSADEHAALKTQSVPFKRGTFRYDSSVLLDEVDARLEQAPFPEVFAALGIDNPSTAGIQVVTTLDVDVQREATYGLWHHLSDIGPALEASSASDLLRPESESSPDTPTVPLTPHSVGTARVVSASQEKRSVKLDFGGRECTVDTAGVDRMVRILTVARVGQKRKSGDKADQAALFDVLKPGALVLASVREAGICDLELRPNLQGGLLVLDDGAIRAMVGGNDNRNFNRAVDAKRQLGSTWKVLVYATAMHLGWTSTDRLDNRTAAFHFEGTWYFPRPDHSPRPVVSLDQAGTMSENLASIWLLHHMLDHLDKDTFASVARQAGLTPDAVGGDRDAWVKRVRDDFGIIATPTLMDQVAFNAAKLEVLAEIPWNDGRRLEVQALLHGAGTARAAQEVGSSDSRRAQKLAALDFNAERLSGLVEECAGAVRQLTRFAADSVIARQRGNDDATGVTALPPSEMFAPLGYRWLDDATFQLACGHLHDGWNAVDAPLLERLAADAPPRVPTMDDLLLDARLPMATFANIQRTRQRWNIVLENQDPYDFEVLRANPDFRTLVGLRHLAARATAYGVTSDLPPVMSLPLGAAEVSLEEAALMVQGIATGRTWSYPGVVQVPGGGSQPTASPERGTLLISEIRDRDGNVLWSANPVATEVGDPVIGRMVGEVLRNVVRWGTGTRANGAVRVDGHPVPLAGKTGTTNSFRNAAFSGFVPSIVDGKWSWDKGFTIASYVGHDDNTPMSRGGIRIAGASGALPAWMGAAEGLAQAKLLGSGVVSGSDEMVVPGGFSRVAVSDEGAGLPIAGSDPDISDARRYALVWGAGMLADGTLDVSRRLTLLPSPGEAAASSALPTVGDANEAVIENSPDFGTDIDIEPFIHPEEE